MLSHIFICIMTGRELYLWFSPFSQHFILFRLHTIFISLSPSLSVSLPILFVILMPYLCLLCLPMLLLIYFFYVMSFFGILHSFNVFRFKIYNFYIFFEVMSSTHVIVLKYAQTDKSCFFFAATHFTWMFNQESLSDKMKWLIFTVQFIVHNKDENFRNIY